MWTDANDLNLDSANLSKSALKKFSALLLMRKFQESPDSRPAQEENVVPGQQPQPAATTVNESTANQSNQEGENHQAQVSICFISI